MKAQALAGVKVLDLSRILAGPLAAQMLADFGAEVIKVERLGSGDEARGYGGPQLQDPQGRPTRFAPMFVTANRNKKSITVDLSQPEGQALVRKLAVWADVLLENYKAGDLRRYGLDYEALRQVNPRLVYCSITGFGQTGPYASRPGYDSVFQAMSGLMSLTGHADGEPGAGPMRVGVPITDFTGGLYAYGAILTALYHRDCVSGEGQHIDLALLDAAITATTLGQARYLATGEAPQRWGNDTPGNAPSGVFACADGDVLLSAPNDRVFQRVCGVLGCPELGADPRFAGKAGRMENKAALVALLAARFRTWHRAPLIEAMERDHVPCAPVYAVPEVYADPQVQARGNIVEVPQATLGTVRLGVNPIRLSATPVAGYTAPPDLGEHNEQVLHDVLGLDAEQIRDLRERKII